MTDIVKNPAIVSVRSEIDNIRDCLAGGDDGSLPHDYPTYQMARDRMDEIERLRAALLRMVCADNGCVATNGHYPCGVHSLSGMWESTKCGCALDARKALEGRDDSTG